MCTLSTVNCKMPLAMTSCSGLADTVQVSLSVPMPLKNFSVSVSLTIFLILCIPAFTSWQYVRGTVIGKALVSLELQYQTEQTVPKKHCGIQGFFVHLTGKFSARTDTLIVPVSLIVTAYYMGEIKNFGCGHSLSHICPEVTDQYFFAFLI